MDNLIGQGIYAIHDVARLTGVSVQKIRKWMQDGGALPAVVHPRENEHPVFTFIDLVEVLVAGQLREHGVSMQRLRKVHVALIAMLSTEHPFAHSRLYTSGRSVILSVLGEDRGEQLLDVLTRQHLLEDVVRPHLRGLEFDPTTELAQRWRIADGVLIDPAIAFGRPILVETGYPTGVLAEAYAANNEDAELVAHWYRVGANEVLRAVEFERSLAA